MQRLSPVANCCKDVTISTNAQRQRAALSKGDDCSSQETFVDDGLMVASQSAASETNSETSGIFSKSPSCERTLVVSLTKLTAKELQNAKVGNFGNDSSSENISNNFVRRTGRKRKHSSCSDTSSSDTIAKK